MKIVSPHPAILVRAVVIAATVGFAVACASSARAQSSTDEAESLVRQGTELRHQNQDARALPFFERAYSLIRNPRTAAQLGLVKMALGYCVDAERLLDEALAVPDHPWIARNLDTLTQTRDSARKNIGEIVVAGSPVGAEILLNGHVVGRLPLSAPIRLDKGPVEIQIRAAAHAPMTRSLKITGGARENLWIALTPMADAANLAPPPNRPSTVAPPPSLAPTRSAVTTSPVAGAPSAATTTNAASETPVDVMPQPPPLPDAANSSASPSSAPSPSPSLIGPLAWTAAAGATVGLALGIVETVVATHKIDDFNNHTAPGTGAPDCAQDQLSDACRSLSDAHDRAKTFAIVGFVATGVLAATSATLFVLSGRQQASSQPDAQSIACAPALPAPGLNCRLTF